MRTLMILFVALAAPLLAAETKQPVVNMVLFISTDCPDCRKLKTEVLPDLRKEFKGQLRIRQVNINTDRGERLYREAIKWASIPENKLYVPTVVIGRDYLVGSKQIGKKLPAMVATGLEDGGIDEPDIPGLSAPTTSRRRTRI